MTKSFLLRFADTSGHSGSGASIKASKMDTDLERSLKTALLPRALMPKAELTIWHLRSIVIGGLSTTLSQRAIRFKQHSSGNYPLVSVRDLSITPRAYCIHQRASCDMQHASHFACPVVSARGSPVLARGPPVPPRGLHMTARGPTFSVTGRPVTTREPPVSATGHSVPSSWPPVKAKSGPYRA